MRPSISSFCVLRQGNQLQDSKPQYTKLPYDWREDICPLVSLSTDNGMLNDEHHKRKGAKYSENPLE